jgi:hypothetical protein
MSEYKEYTVRVLKDRTEWLYNGKRHREEGPAIQWQAGGEEWWLDGTWLSEAEFNRRIKPPTPCRRKVVEIEGKRYRLVAE